MAKLEELRKDLGELNQLLLSARRLRSQNLINKEINDVTREISALEEKNNSSAPGGGARYIENISNYAWDQSDKFTKLYIYLPKLNEITDDNIHYSFTEKSVTVKVNFLEKTSQLQINRLCEHIVDKDSYCKKKSDYVLVMMKKADVGKTWPWLTEREKKAKESKDKDKSKITENEDPSAGITSMLKNMYDEGDDEMKRTISKAFYESQQKQGMGPGAFDSL